MNVSTQPVWAEERFEHNKVRQLLVPDSTLDVTDEDGLLRVSNGYGSWPAVRTAAETADALTAVLPSRSGNVRWQGGRTAYSPQAVVESYREAIGFRPHGEPRSLRRPQIGALHAVLGHWASGLGDPGIVVMPTGTGKTETMLALLVAARMERLLVLVPSAALRDQITGKFETLGILQQEQIVTPAALRPRVGRLEHGFKDPEEAAHTPRLAALVPAVVVLERCRCAASRRRWLSSRDRGRRRGDRARGREGPCGRGGVRHGSRSSDRATSRGR